jgi:hypothetical protein
MNVTHYSVLFKTGGFSDFTFFDRQSWLYVLRCHLAVSDLNVYLSTFTHRVDNVVDVDTKFFSYIRDIRGAHHYKNYL